MDGVVLLDHLLYVREESYPKVKFQPAAFFIWKIYAKEDLGLKVSEGTTPANWQFNLGKLQKVCCENTGSTPFSYNDFLIK